jgi:glutamate N-acetyltransferase/amino-acid N-acetyltransferase
MLSFLFTDAPIAAPALQAMLGRAADISMNAMTVDGDTSTSDTLMIFATGAAQKRGAAPITSATDARLRPFKAALNAVLENLAKQVARDGEGARKFVEINVTGASSPRSAKKIARAIAESPLVKTAIAGEDANWGRVVMAVGKAGEPADRDKLSISFNGVRVAHKGERDSRYDEAEVSALMKREDIVIDIDLGIGKGRSRMWTCDLTKAYVEINGDYRS